MSKFLNEFKDFAMRGNVVDMAVGVIIGAAFGKIVTSVVNDILMPPLGFLLGGVNFTDLSFKLLDYRFLCVFACQGCHVINPEKARSTKGTRRTFKRRKITYRNSRSLTE